MTQRALRVAACQFAHATREADAVARAEAALGSARDAGAGLALLPEYWFSGPGAEGEPDGRDAVARLSKAVPGLVVAGPELRRTGGGIQNVGVLALDGRVLGAQPKLRPTEAERARGVVPGAGLGLIPTPLGRAVVLVCADVLDLDVVADAARAAPDLTLVPVLSRSRFGDHTLRARRDLFVARAFDLRSVVVKASGYTPDGLVAGRSLVAAPWGLVAMAAHPYRDACVVGEIDLDRLDAFRREHASFTRTEAPPR